MPHYITEIHYDLVDGMKVNPRYSLTELDPQNPAHRFLMSAEESEAEPFVPKPRPEVETSPPRIVTEIVEAIWAHAFPAGVGEPEVDARARELATEAVMDLVKFRSAR